MRVSIRDKPERFADNYGGVTNAAVDASGAGDGEGTAANGGGHPTASLVERSVLLELD